MTIRRGIPALSSRWPSPLPTPVCFHSRGVASALILRSRGPSGGPQGLGKLSVVLTPASELSRGTPSRAGPGRPHSLSFLSSAEGRPQAGRTRAPGWVSRQVILGARPAAVTPLPSVAAPGGLVILAGDRDRIHRGGRRGRRPAAAPGPRPRATRVKPLSGGGLFVRVLRREKPRPTDSVLFQSRDVRCNSLPLHLHWCMRPSRGRRSGRAGGALLLPRLPRPASRRRAGGAREDVGRPPGSSSAKAAPTHRVSSPVADGLRFQRGSSRWARFSPL